MLGGAVLTLVLALLAAATRPGAAGGGSRPQAGRSDALPPVRDIASTPQIFADTTDLESFAGATIELGQPTLSDEPVFALQEPWEAGFRLGDYSSIFQLNETAFALIYALQGNDTSMNGLSFNAYAETTDGVHFTRPTLGQVSFGKWGTENNLIEALSGRFGEHKSGREGSSVTVDPSRALGGRFIAAAKMENCSNYLMFAVSDDGKRWEDRATWYGGDPGADNQPTLLYDPARKDWCVRMRVLGCPSVCWP